MRQTGYIKLLEPLHWRQLKQAGQASLSQETPVKRESCYRMQLYKKLIGFILGFVLLIGIISLTWFFWPTSIDIDIDIDESKNQDNEKIFGTIKGKTEHSQNNNSSHINFGGHFLFTILIFVLLVSQTVLHSYFYLRFI